MPLLFLLVLGAAAAAGYAISRRKAPLPQRLAEQAGAAFLSPHGTSTHAVIRHDKTTDEVSRYGSFNSDTAAIAAINAAPMTNGRTTYYLFAFATPGRPVAHLDR